MEYFTQVLLVISTNSDCRSAYYNNRKGYNNLGLIILKIRVYFDGMVSKKKFFWDYSNRI